jgi:hypothetical protein
MGSTGISASGGLYGEEPQRGFRQWSCRDRPEAGDDSPLFYRQGVATDGRDHAGPFIETQGTQLRYLLGLQLGVSSDLIKEHHCRNSIALWGLCCCIRIIRNQGRRIRDELRR